MAAAAQHGWQRCSLVCPSPCRQRRLSMTHPCCLQVSLQTSLDLRDPKSGPPRLYAFEPGGHAWCLAHETGHNSGCSSYKHACCQ